jgi:hypothetical protein
MLTNNFQRTTAAAGIAALTSLAGLATALPANAAAIGFNNWIPFGDVATYTTNDAEMSTNSAFAGEDRAFAPKDPNVLPAGYFNFSGNKAQTPNAVAFFLGVAPSVFGSEAVEGSAIKNSITANAGDVFSFVYSFGTNETNPNVRLKNDFAFFSVNGDVFKLADALTTPVSNGNSPFYTDTANKTFSYKFLTTGSYTLGLGVFDVGSVPSGRQETSGLAVADAKLTPVPAPSLLAPLAAMGVNAIVRRRKDKKATA